ncbi:hypothetical protein J5N97_019779 [Dioscorea zingiberensis]|uniref:Uncharacterized protein n=1 Tax=Dioscorea zingiberensis TaxID=325984 RepID=A0A9D5HD11_9LILI|nr:hypothetical protein J5N97_019779 [Dioscorea zingiberensis]
MWDDGCSSFIKKIGYNDVIRVVHANGRVEEITHSIGAAEFMKSYPKHVLRRPPEDDNGIVPPNAELQKGKIYFLMPVSVGLEKEMRRRRRRRREVERQRVASHDRASFLMSDQYLLEILSEVASHDRDRRRGRVGIWRPHLETISEVSCDL